MYLATIKYSTKLLTTELFYLGGIVLGTFFYLTGLSVAQVQSILIVIFLDIATRCWAEHKNKRPILSRRMFTGFAGKFASYMILFILANHSFIFNEAFLYAILGGFSLVESRSIFENLKDAGQKHVSVISDKIEKEFEKFTGKKEESEQK
jgi:hypothetical protein